MRFPEEEIEEASMNSQEWVYVSVGVMVGMGVISVIFKDIFIFNIGLIFSIGIFFAVLFHELRLRRNDEK